MFLFKAQSVYDYRLVIKIIFGFILIGLLLLWRYYELKKYNQKLLYLSETDLLTQIYNRTKIDQALHDNIDTAEKTHEPLSLLLIDVDYFKTVNDTFGHPVGDQILIEIVQLIKESIRRYDILGRWGGEEFLILCPKTTQDEALKVAERIQKKIKNAVFTTQQRHSVSIGIATLRLDDTPHTLISHADAALYQAKKDGRDTISIAPQ